LAVYDANGNALAATEKLATGSSSVPGLVIDTLKRGIDASAFETAGNKRTHVYVMPILTQEGAAGALVVVQDATYIQGQLGRIWQIAFFVCWSRCFSSRW